MNTKVCSKCFVDKPLDAFHRSARIADGRQRWCKDCSSSHSRLRFITNQHRINERKRQYRAANRHWINPYHHAKQKVQRLWMHGWIIAILGGKCVKCGTEHKLCIDHIDENGREHRSECGWKNGRNGGPTQRIRYYRDVLESGCDGLQVLCGSCNTRKSNDCRRIQIPAWCLSKPLDRPTVSN